MKTTFTARHFQASKELHTYSEDALQKLDHFYDRITGCDIILERTPDDESPFQAEVNCQIPGTLLNAKEKGDSYEQAINMVVENITRQLKKYKNKHYVNH